MLRLPAPTQVYDAREQAILRADIEKAVLRLHEEVRENRVSPRVLDIFLSFDESGQAFVRVRCNEDTLSIRYAVADGAAPSLETVQAATVAAGATHEIYLTGPYIPGTLLFVSVIPYAGPSGDGRQGQRSTQSATFGMPQGNLCRAVVLASSDTTITVRVTAQSNAGASVVRLVDMTGTTKVSGPDVGVDGGSPQVYVFNRPAAEAGDGLVRFRGTFPDSSDDDDILVIPEQGKGLVFLACMASIILLTETQAIVRVAVADPFPQDPNQVQVAYTTDGIPSVSPASPQTITPGAVFSSAVGRYVDFVVQRPAAAAGEVTFEVTSLGATRIPDQDVVKIPQREVVPASLEVGYTFDDEEYEISWDGEEVVELSINGGAFGEPPESPFTVARAAASGGKNKSYTFRATGSLGDVKTETVIVLKKELPLPPTTPVITDVTLDNGFTPGDGGGSFDVLWTTDNMPTTETYDVEWEVLSGDPISSGSGLEENVSSGVTINTPLGNGATVRVKVLAYDGGLLIAEKEIITAVPIS